MTAIVQDGQHVVNEPVRPRRTPAGDLFTELVTEVAWLGTIITAAGEALAAAGGQTLARWLVLDVIEDRPSTVAQIARRRGIARQAVQRVADLLVEDGLAAFEPNPAHRRAKLLRPTPAGRAALHRISVEQQRWADATAATIGEGRMRKALDLVAAIRPKVAMPHVATVDGARDAA
jgi:DNA-binding MarR family transcriptional regulator